MALKCVLVMGPGQSCLLIATIASQTAMEGLKERVPNYKSPRAPYGHNPVALSPSGCQTFSDEARIFEPFFPIPSIPLLCSLLHRCCAPSTPQSVSVGPALSLPRFERVTNGMVKGLHAFYHVATVSLRRQGIWKLASGAADAQESQFYEVSGSFWPLLRKGSVGKTP